MINISCLKLKTYDPGTLNFKILVEVSIFTQTVYQVCLPDAFHFWWRAQVSLQIKDWKKYWHFWSYWGSLHNYAFSNPKLRLKAPAWLDKYFHWFVSYSDPKEHDYQYVLLIFFNSKAFSLKKLQRAGFLHEILIHIHFYLYEETCVGQMDRITLMNILLVSRKSNSWTKNNFWYLIKHAPW